MNCQNPKCLTKLALRVYRKEVTKEYLVCDACGNRIEISTTTGEVLPVLGTVAAITGALFAFFAWWDDHA